MLQFKSYLKEARASIKTTAELLAVIGQYDQEPEILNPDFVYLKEQTGYLFRDAFQPVQDLILAFDYNTRTKFKELDDAYFGTPDSVVGLKKYRKTIATLAKAKSDIDVSHIVKLANDTLDIWDKIKEGLDSLKGKTVKIATKRAEVKVAKAKETERKKGDSKSMIAALEAHRSEFVKKAGERAKEFIDDKLVVLANNDWDLYKLVPRRTYDRTKNALANFYMSITDEPIGHSLDTNIRRKSTKKMNEYIDSAKKMAEADYDGFIAKMVEKVGAPVVKASLTGNIWTNATLTVTTDVGEEQVWTTKMIINFSKYQKPFNQFPSKRKK